MQSQSVQSQSRQNDAVFLRRLGLFAMVPIGLLLLAGAATSICNTSAWLKRTVEAQGTVVEMLGKRDKDGDALYTPVVRFSTAEGRTIRFESSFSSKPAAYHTGESVTVVYLQNEPEHASIRGLPLWIGSMILTFIGTIFFGTGAAMVAAGRSGSRAPTQGAAAA